MQRIILLFLGLMSGLLLSSLSAQDTVLVERAYDLSLDEKINENFQPITDATASIVFYPVNIKKNLETYRLEDVDGKRLSYFDDDTPWQVKVLKYGQGTNGMVIDLDHLTPTTYKATYNYTGPERNKFKISRVFTYGKPAKVGNFKFQVSAPAVAPTNSLRIVPNTIAMPLVIIMLLLAALIFTFYFGFVQFRRIKLAINTVRGVYSDPNEPGEVSHFQALTAALSGTVGLGNIAGVAIAISLGGPGATFWMILAGLLGMASKFTECTLGVKYRDIGPHGKVHGGPMYYLSRGLKARGMNGLGKVLAGFFAVMCVGGSFGGGNMFQSNQAAQQFNSMVGATSGSAGLIFGVVMAVIVAMVIIGGIKRIGSVTEKVVPAMAILYVASALIVLFANYSEIPHAVGLIFKGAFAPTAVAGGFVGVLVQGFRRAAFSNEAGVGSAAIAHSAVKTDYPASEGIVALLEPFIDTVVVCTMTALVIIVTGNYINPEGYSGVDLTSNAFATVLPWFPYLLTIAVVLFAFSTMLSWSYYGLQSWMYLFGRSKIANYTYKTLFCIFVVLGSAASLGAVTDFSDAMIFAMAVPNLIGLLILMPEVRHEIRRYVNDIKVGVIKRYK